MSEDIFIGTSDEKLVFSKYFLKGNTLIANRERWSTYDVDAVLENSWTDKYELSKDDKYALENAAISDKRKIRKLGIKLADSFYDKDINKEEVYNNLMKDLVLKRAKNIRSISKQSSKVR